MAEKTVREQLAMALERIEALARPDPDWPVSPDSLLKTAGRIAHDNLDRARAEPEGCICDTCPVCAVSVRDCQCYQEGTEAQREPAGRGTA